MTTDPTPDRLDDLRTEYANTGMVTSDGAVWLFSQVLVLREEAARAAGPAPVEPPTACVCREPDAPGIAHRSDGPCYQVEPLHRMAAMALARLDAHEWATGIPLEEQPVWQAYLSRADAVLAVLPAPVDRAAVLREAADVAEDEAAFLYDDMDQKAAAGARHVADRLRRLADETPQPETEDGGCTCGVSGEEFRPAGHYRDCPAAPAVAQPDEEA